MADLEKELLYRLLKSHFRAGDQDESFYVGELPPDFPVSLPADIKLLGSLERRSSPGIKAVQGMSFSVQDHTQVVLDTPLSPAEFIRQVREGLSPDWQDFHAGPTTNDGFVAASAQGELTRSSSTRELFMNMQAEEVQGVTRVSINVNAVPKQNMEHMHLRPEDYGHGVTVRVPPDANIYPSGGGGGGNQWHSSAMIETNVSMADMLSDFSVQLAAQGWSALTHDRKEKIAAGTWLSAADGLLLITLKPVETGFFANMITVRPDKNIPGSSTSFTISS